jgi:hypothetical protein
VVQAQQTPTPFFPRAVAAERQIDPAASRNVDRPALELASDHSTGLQSLGARHRLRDEAAAAVAREQFARDTSLRTASLARWPGIVAALQTLAAAYNAGVGRALVVVAETDDRRQRALTIEAQGQTKVRLMVTLDDGELRVESVETGAAGRAPRWVDLGRTDNGTAAYVLQEWMERL